MIHVERGPAPGALLLPQVLRFVEMTRKHHAIARAKRPAWEPPPFPRPALRATRTALTRLFNAKCAYCETRMGAGTDGSSDSDSDIERFRPRGGVSESSGQYLGDHYWAQAFEWENLYLCCPNCNRSKSNRFPVEPGSHRAAADADRAALRLERPMLLDPCGSDDPDQHLLFGADGMVSGLSARGQATIEVLGLNRPTLCKDRQTQAKIFLAALRSGKRGSNAGVDGLLDAAEPFLALKRQLKRTHDKDAAGARESRALESRAKGVQARYDSSRDQVDTRSAKGLDNFRARARYIERVRIENIASIHRIELDLQASTSGRAPCFALLGVNGVGKSSVLKAIALALAGPGCVKRLQLKATDLLRDGAAEGRVCVWLGGFTEPVEMRLTRRGNHIRFAQQEVHQLVLGYGASRLLPTPKHPPITGERHAKIDNLFDPFLPLADAQAWLSGPQAASHWDDVARTVASLLPAEDGGVLQRPTRKGQPFHLQQPGREPRLLRELSDGFQSTLGLAADILEIVYGLGYESALSAQGVVLIDELGNHLHPAWRMRIVAALRKAFPQVQFIYSTHEPLCLRGLADGEVAVMRLSTRHAVQVLTELPSITGLRVDQLLTSEHFGLDSTLDPETERAMKRYRQLLALKRPSAPLAKELDELRTQLDDARLLGTSWRERRLLQAIDSEAEAEKTRSTAPQVSVKDLSEQTVQRLRTLMKRMKPPRRPAASRATR